MTVPFSLLPLLIGLLGIAVTALNSFNLQRAGVKTWVLPLGDDLEGFLGRSFLVLIAGYAGILLAAAISGYSPGDGQQGGRVLAWLGLGLMALGVMTIGLAQRDMGRSWRVGIPRETVTLVETGLFRHSRNPVFLGMLMMACGIALAIPHTVSFISLAVTYVSLSAQIRLEESFLAKTLGHDYADYRNRVRRWL